MSGTDAAVWVNSRQYTGRIVTVTNGATFDEPVYSYSRAFPYLWEEIVLPVAYPSTRRVLADHRQPARAVTARPGAGTPGAGGQGRISRDVLAGLDATG